MTDTMDFMEEHFAAAGVSADDTSTGPSVESGNTQAAQEPTPKVEGAPGKDNVSSADNKGVEPGKETKGQAAPTPEVKPGVQTDGSLILNDGTKVAAGAERRHFDQMNLARQREQLARTDLNTITQKHTALETKYNTLEASVRQIGLEKPEDVSSAVNLFKDLQRDVVGTIQKLLVEAKAKGYALDGIGASVDTQAIHAILDQRLKPSEQDTQVARQQEIAAQVQQEVTELIALDPLALTHEAYIAAVVDSEAKAGRQISLRDAYFALKEKVVGTGLDWSQPLGPQIEAAKQRASQQLPQDAPRTGGPAITVASEIDPAKVITPDSDTSDSIVRAAMKEAGMLK